MCQIITLIYVFRTRVWRFLKNQPTLAFTPNDLPMCEFFLFGNFIECMLSFEPTIILRSSFFTTPWNISIYFCAFIFGNFMEHFSILWDHFLETSWKTFLFGEANFWVKLMQQFFISWVHFWELPQTFVFPFVRFFTEHLNLNRCEFIFGEFMENLNLNEVSSFLGTSWTIWINLWVQFWEHHGRKTL